MVANDPYVDPLSQPWAREVSNGVDKNASEIERVEKNLSNTTNALSANQSALAVALRNLVTGNYTKAEVDSKDAAVLAVANSKANLSHTHDGADIVSGTVGRNVSATNTEYAPSVTGIDVYAQSLATNITASRVTLWGRTSDGYIATASSSERYKTNIRETDIDPQKILSVLPVYYSWIADVQERDRRRNLPTDDPDFAPDWHVSTEVGFIAERLHELGLWQFVVYERNRDGSLKLDEKNEAIPEGIHYINWGIALQVVVRYQEKRINDLEQRLTSVENKVE